MVVVEMELSLLARETPLVKFDDGAVTRRSERRRVLIS